VVFFGAPDFFLGGPPVLASAGLFLAAGVGLLAGCNIADSAGVG
jgi:hypothetical protein